MSPGQKNKKVTKRRISHALQRRVYDENSFLWLCVDKIM